jgi:DNA-binding response OmpR family regulator
MAKILLIETDRILASNLQDFLLAKGHQLDWQVDPQQAVFSADDNQPDVVILDLMLAGRSGVEFLYEFRSYPEWQELPVVVFSNISERELGQCIAAFPQLNITAYHYKPHTSLQQLSRTVEQILAPVNL